MKKSCVCALTFGLFWTCVPGYAAGLLKNAEFSERVSAESGLPAAWQSPPADRECWRVVDDDGHSGKDSLRYRAAEARKTGQVTQEVVCQPNTEYVLVAWLKGDGTLKPLVRVIAPDTVGQRVTQVVSDGQPKWTRHAVRFNSGAAKRLIVEVFGDVEHGSAKPAAAGAAWVDDVQILGASELPPGEPVEGGLMPKAPGENLARGKTYSLDPKPNYGYCTEPGDATQLTDGEYSVGYFWTQKSTVGWQNTPMAQVTIDLGKVEPICGLSFNTAAGTAGVGWPSAISVLVSDDGKVFYPAGELVSLSAERGLPPPEGYRVHRFWTDKLATRGRFVKVVLAVGGPYAFVDEVEVYRGPEALLAKAPQGEAITDMRVFFRRGQMRAAIQRRLAHDAQALRESVSRAPLHSTEQGRLLAELKAIAAEAPKLADTDMAAFRAVFPLNALHARLFRVQAALWRSQGQPPLVVWQTPLWDPLSPLQSPPPTLAKVAKAGVDVVMMQDEYRAGAFNVSNTTDRDMTLRVRVDGLPGGANPRYVMVHEVSWTDTKLGVPVAAALPEAQRDGTDSLISVPIGMTRQVWLTFSPADVKPGTHEGRIALDGEGVKESLPLRLRVAPLRFPAQPTLHLGGWDYTDGESMYGAKPTNRQALITHLREHFVDTPWATASVLPPAAFSAANEMTAEPDYKRFDEWVTRWPGARQYFVFLSVGGSFAGAKMGTPEFDKRVGLWISAWVKHLAELDIKPNQLGLLLVDEPTKPEQDEIIMAWTRAIKAVEPKVLIWEDACHGTWGPAPDWNKAKAMMSLCDVLCPNRPAFLRTAAYREAFLEQKAAGRTLNFYSCSGPVRSLDPYAYQRLQAWTCWQHGATGMFYWAFGDNGGGSAW
ncbi:MAG: hypothetical protein FJ278_03705, partial [Planctomycetes bacterium]|nr:hypothetical protein [Planctomycetota bacterium]